MEQNKTDPIDLIIAKWQALTLGKKSLAVGLLLVAAFIVYTVVISMFSVAPTGLYESSTPPMMGDGDSYNSSYDKGEMASPGRVAMAPQPYGGMVYEDDYIAGTNAEDFETKSYTARIETSDLDATCGTLDALKPQANIIFLSASQSVNGCSYNFKVAKAEVDSVLATLESLDPKELIENTVSIKKQIENNLDQKTILNDNLLATEEILNDALAAYDSLLATAAAERNSEALAKAVRDKIELIDELRQRREFTMQQIDYLNKQLAEQQDRLDYVTFNVSVIKVVYFDGEAMKSSWQKQLEQTFRSINEALQGLTLGLVIFIVYTLLYTLYAVLALIILKFGWRIVRRITRG